MAITEGFRPTYHSAERDNKRNQQRTPILASQNVAIEVTIMFLLVHFLKNHDFCCAKTSRSTCLRVVVSTHKRKPCRTLGNPSHKLLVGLPFGTSNPRDELSSIYARTYIRVCVGASESVSNCVLTLAPVLQSVLTRTQSAIRTFQAWAMKWVNNVCSRPAWRALLQGRVETSTLSGVQEHGSGWASP